MLAGTELWLAINKEYSRSLKERNLKVQESGDVGRDVFYAACLTTAQTVP